MSKSERDGDAKHRGFSAIDESLVSSWERFLFLLLLNYVFVFGSVSYPSSSARVPSSSTSKVSLALYYETLCPYSANFIVKYLPKVYDEGLISIVDLELFPYGNAKLQDKDNIVCQSESHGFRGLSLFRVFMFKRRDMGDSI
ncbi:gamma-interferon-responsive lysosomal thiol protein-like [Macadamia integrifolia]|uniref:gamma-interferon-responsive lysosomal thiol protein-like n=1 Tax=Macadamia integrifolia TaxID=60698 RepID=UPI001C4FC061|nr:gamma-interferon-responsive lysosomal thiol protein-like [Macadamia integrifolia]